MRDYHLQLRQSATKKLRFLKEFYKHCHKSNLVAISSEYCPFKILPSKLIATVMFYVHLFIETSLVELP